MNGSNGASERDQRIVSMHVEERLSLTEIGCRFDLSHERIRQIVRREGVPVEVTQQIKREVLSEANSGPVADFVCEWCGAKETLPETAAKRRRFCSKECCDQARFIPVPDLIAYMRELGEELGHTPGVDDLIRAGGYSHTTYYRVFGSLGRAQELAGFEAMPSGQHGHRT